MKKIFSAFFALILMSSISYGAKINTELLNTISAASSNDEISAMVYMKDKLDKSMLPKKTAEKISALKKFSETSQRDIQDFIKRSKNDHNVKAIKKFWMFNGFLIVTDKDLVLSLSKRPDVERIEENSAISLEPEPPYNAMSFAMRPSASSTIEPNITQIKAEQVWAIVSGGQNVDGTGVKVGVADTGCLATHPDLVGKVTDQASFDANGNQNGSLAPDQLGHGTHVAGIIVGGNASGTSIGVAPSANLSVAKVFDATNDSATQARVVGAVEWLIQKNCKIINLSLGGTNGYASPFWKFWVDEHWDIYFNDVIILSAIGNGGPSASTTTSPGNVPSSIGVGAVDANDEIEDFSSRGPVIWSGADWVKPDISAPGFLIKSSWNDGGYNNSQGTSMAAPHVAGVLALMMCANPTLESSSAKAIIKNTAYHVAGASSWPNNTYGWGRIDALTAVYASMVSDTTKPSIESIQVQGGQYGEDITISAAITSNVTGSQPISTLYYKNANTSWESASMNLVTGTSMYSATIPGSFVKTNISYFISAKNILDNKALSPDNAPDSSYLISITPQSTISISEAITCPNPFSPGNESATFAYYLSKVSDVTVRVYTLSGQCAKTFSSSGTLGYNSFTWDGSFEGGELAANGVYLYQIIAKDSSGSTSSARGKIIALR